MKTKVLIPNGVDRDTLNARESMLSRAVSSGTQMSVDCIPDGAISIESVTNEVMAGPYLLEAGWQAQRKKYDAFVVDCFSDLVVDALRKNLPIPVVEPRVLSAADTLVLGCLELVEYGDALEVAARLNLRPSRRSYGSVGTQEEV